MGDAAVNDMKFQFRTAALGGFHKQDVLAYLEVSSREHAEKLTALQGELAEEKVARAELEERSADLDQRVRALTEENQRLAADLARREAELNQAAAQRDAAVTETTQLRAKMEQLEPAATAYESIKDRASAIELEAHSRALAIEGEAHRTARRIADEMEGWLRKFQAAYNRLRTDVDGTLGKAVEELHQTESELGKISEEFSCHDAALQVLREKMEILIGPQAPMPLPTEESDQE